MGQILKTRYDANEMAKNLDFNHGETREIENLNTLLEYLLKPSSKDVIITGGTVKERSTPSMNVDIDPILAFIRSSGKFVHAGSTLGPVSIVNGGEQNRIDTLEVRYKETAYDTQQRAYKDPATDHITYQDFDTKARYEMEAQVIQGTEGAGNAPNHTVGWIKLAEIFVEAEESTSILDADIKNCTAGKDGETTAAWTAETDTTFRLESLSDIKTKFRAKHKEDGDHVDDVIKDQHIDWGTGANQVDGDLIPLGTAISSTEINIANSDSIRSALNAIAQAVNRPVGIVWMFDGTGWVDNDTLPGWYACIPENSGLGCPDMVDEFVMGKVIAGAGSTGGSNTIVDHTHACENKNIGNKTSGNQSVSHKHDTVMGSHGHAFRVQAMQTPGTHTYLTLNIGDQLLDGTSNYDVTITSSVVSENLGTKESGNQKASHTHTTNIGSHLHTIGSGSVPGLTDNRPAYYSMIYIKKCA